MGATDVTLIFEGKLSASEVEKKIQEQRREDSAQNGHQDGYSGDWQTISDIKYTSQVFNSRADAYEWCVQNCEKWSGVAVKFKRIGKIKPNSKIEKLEARLLAEKTKGAQKHGKAVEALKSAKSKKIGCKKCGSSINRSYLKGFECPICRADFRTETYMKDAKRRNERIEQLEKDIKTEKDSLVKKAAEKTSDIMWLVFGLAAC